MPTRAPLAAEARALSYLALARITARLRQRYSAQPVTGLVVERMSPQTVGPTADLFRTTIPDALVTQLGRRLLLEFLRFLESQPDAGVWVARGADGSVVGFLAGVLDRPGVYTRLTRVLRFPLVRAIVQNAWKPSVLNWFRLALLARLRSKMETGAQERPSAELIAMGVADAARGQGIGARLVTAFEAQLRAWGYAGDYVILTGIGNETARRFYERLGAHEVTAVEYRGHHLVEFHKSPAGRAVQPAPQRPGSDAA